MATARLFWSSTGAALLGLVLAGCPKDPSVAVPEPAGRCGLQADGSKVFVLMHINDVYRIEGHLDGGGGLARVRSLREELEAECGGPVLLTHAGDAFYPSLGSEMFDGRHMVDVLSMMDGAPDAEDPYMVGVFGNHEFDEAMHEQADDFFALVDDSDFLWLDTNITWNESVLQQGLLEETVSLELHGARVGIYGLTIDKDAPAFGTIDDKYFAESDRRVAELSPDHDVVLALTHLDKEDDKRLLTREARPHLVLGGHDHTAMRFDVDGRFAIKADADARTAVVAWVTVKPDGTVVVDDELRVLGEDTGPERDAAVDARVMAWERALAWEYCSTTDRNGDEYPKKARPSAPNLECLSEIITSSATPIEAAEHIIRSRESNLGDWLADLALEEFAGVGAQVVLINSGGLRLNQNLPPGAIRVRQVAELFPYKGDLAVLDVSGATVKAALAHGVTNWGSAGKWLQVAGITFRFDPDTETVSDVHIIEDGVPRAIVDDETVRVVVTKYMAGGGDDYKMFNGIDAVDAEGRTLRAMLTAALDAAGDAGVAPKVDGRICDPKTRPEVACLLDR